MKFCDISTFYCATGGGSRTYYRAKINWFAGQQEHHYTLIFPGPGFEITRPAANVTLVQVFGVRVTRDPSSYRLILDVRRVARTLRELRPDVLETGDPWISGPLALILRRRSRRRLLLSSMYHSDPIATYVTPRRRFRAAHSLLDRTFTRVQRLYDVTITASNVMADRLRSRGVRVAVAPFGVDSMFFDIAQRCSPCPSRGVGLAARPVRVLYAGRLDAEKEVDLLLEVMPRLLDMPGVQVTVAGKGSRGDKFALIQHPRFAYAGFVSDSSGMRQLYERHDVLVAPGRYETFGLAALEAAAAGLVVVGPDAGGTGELLRQMPAPHMFRAGDAESLVEAIRNATSSDLVKASAESREVARRYGTWGDAIARQVHMYEDLL